MEQKTNKTWSIEKFLVSFFIMFGFSWSIPFYIPAFPFISGFLLRTVILAILTYVLWRSWGKHGGIILAGVIVFFSSFLGSLLLILIAPIVLSSVKLSIALLFYALFREFFVGLKIPNNAVRTSGVIVSLVVGVAMIYPSVDSVKNSGYEDILQPNHPYIGKRFVFQIPLAYDSDCIYCGDTGISKEINRDLECIDDLSGVGRDEYKNNLKRVEYVPSNTEFEVKQVFTVKPYGFHIDASKYDLVILEDPQGNKSTAFLSQIDDFVAKKYDGFCLSNPEPMIMALFSYLEQHHTVQVFIHLVDYGAYGSKKAIPYSALLKDFQKGAFFGYAITNIQPYVDPVTHREGVLADVDANAAVFLLAGGLPHVYLDYPAEEEVLSLMPIAEREYFEKQRRMWK